MLCALPVSVCEIVEPLADRDVAFSTASFQVAGALEGRSKTMYVPLARAFGKWTVGLSADTEPADTLAFVES
ncbi:hypothetical protein [Xanthomonas oryzae]|uniref:hypothetical protein n=1 Tax=Xanthomonas oryzae TaxID=347 RepID=UPI001F231839|nr:hypothetical protein [Xanthomonas oryzae]